MQQNTLIYIIYHIHNNFYVLRMLLDICTLLINNCYFDFQRKLCCDRIYDQFILILIIYTCIILI